MVQATTQLDLDLGLPAPDKQDTGLALVVRDFLSHCGLRKGLASHTLRAYAADLGDWLNHIGQTIVPPEITKDNIEEYLKHLVQVRRLKHATVKRRLATVKVLFKWMAREGITPRNAIEGLELALRAPKRLPRALDPQDLTALLRYARRMADERGRFEDVLLYLVVVVLFTTGLRIGELVTLRVGHVSVADGTIQVSGKGNRERRVYLPGGTALEALRRYLVRRRQVVQPQDHLVVMPSGAPATTGYVRRRLKAAAKAAGIQRTVTPHMLRHTAATQLLEADVDIRFVQKLLGHASILTTQLYTEVRDRALRERLLRANTLARVGLR